MEILKSIICLLFMSCTASGPVFLNANSQVKGAEIQPAKALHIAKTHLTEHGTVIWKDKSKLKVHIIKKGKYYYVKQSDFPAKTANWYVNKSIRIHCQTGKVKYMD